LAGYVLPAQGGVMSLPTYRFPNGEQQIWVRGVNDGIPVDTDEDGLADSRTTFASWGSVTVTFSNDVYMENFSPLYSAYGLTYFATTPHNYTFEVFRVNGDLLHTQTGVIDRSLSPPWNFTDLTGQPVDDAGYIFSLTAAPVEGGQMGMMTQPSSAGMITNDDTATTPLQPQKFQTFSTGELLLVQSGASLPEITPPEPNLTDQELIDLIAKIASLEPAPPPPLPPPVPWPPVLPPSYTANTTAMNEPNAAGTKKIVTTNFFDKGVTVGQYVISYGEWPRQDINDRYREMSDAVSWYVNTAAFFDSDIIGENRYTHSPVHADFTADPYAIRKPTQTNDLLALTNALADANVGSWLWEGHSFPEQMIAGDDGHLTVVLSAKDLAAVLGNKIGPNWAMATNLIYNRRLMSTFITGCGTLNGTWPLAAGTPPGVDQVENLIKKSVFLGFAGISYANATKMGWIVEIHKIWIDGFNYDTPVKAGLDIANIRYPAVMSWGPGLHGFRSLIYSGDDSR
jgi:hypothetical protein